jgi:hypothetical protein
VFFIMGRNTNSWIYNLHVVYASGHEFVLLLIYLFLRILIGDQKRKSFTRGLACCLPSGGLPLDPTGPLPLTIVSVIGVCSGESFFCHTSRVCVKLNSFRQTLHLNYIMLVMMMMLIVVLLMQELSSKTLLAEFPDGLGIIPFLMGLSTAGALRGAELVVSGPLENPSPGGCHVEKGESASFI